MSYHPLHLDNRKSIKKLYISKPFYYWHNSIPPTTRSTTPSALTSPISKPNTCTSKSKPSEKYSTQTATSIKSIAKFKKKQLPSNSCGLKSAKRVRLIRNRKAYSQTERRRYLINNKLI